MTDIEIIRALCIAKAMRWTNHIFVRLVERGISIEDIENAIMTGEIIESYPKDYPTPSFLISGLSVNSKKIHVVCGVGDELHLITAYYPDIITWTNDYTTRRG
ncbi:hypothetical protein FACS1894219_05870 [Clostridia bacterium]|nr:hypothetical protein FACS1894219_05870 [Clostridia bacterium]